MTIHDDIELVAEIANAHQGNILEAIELTESLSNNGAKAVKYQIYTGEELLVPDHPRYQHFVDQSFSEIQWNELISCAKSLGLRVYADVFGLDSLQIARKHEISGLKIHSSDTTNYQLLSELCPSDGIVLLSAGGSTPSEIQYALEILRNKSISDFCLLHGFQAYPTHLSDTKLNRIKELNDIFGPSLKYGYMDHVDGATPYSLILPLLALPYGISYIEKHVTLRRERQGVDYFSSLEPQEFARFQQYLLDLAKVFCDDPLTFSNAEVEYRTSTKKSWVATKNLSAGHKVLPEDLIMKRTQSHNPPPFFEELVSRKTIRSISTNEPVDKSFVTHQSLAICVARSKSTRLPGKAMLNICKETAIEHLVKRLIAARDLGYIDNIAFCTTTDPSDDDLYSIASTLPINVYRGSEVDVLDRMKVAMDDFPDHDCIVRVTGDDILVDPEYIKKTIDHHLETNSDYTDAKRLPAGMETEVFNAATLSILHANCIDTTGTEYLTNYITNNSYLFRTTSLPVPEHISNPNYRLTIDTKEDLEVVRRIVDYMAQKGRQYNYTVDDVVTYLSQNPDVITINQVVSQRSAPPSINTKINLQFSRSDTADLK
jgi:N,N'-diacetyllegionaminate synthase